ncbi:MAG: pyridoxamine 5'-phosphate oxidase family protein [Paracoccaceae bacterium]
MDNYGSHLFTEAVQAEQASAGTRERYAQVYKTRHRGPLDADARAFIETRTSFYMASIGASGWPYVQHRGGPAGFLKVLGPEQIGFADYTGNKQFISMGNMAGDDRVSLILMDYPHRARMKLIGHARMIHAEKAPALAEQLHVKGEGPVERVATIDITAMDWNCPKYITPRFTEEEIAAMLGPRMRELKQENATLRARVAELEAGGGK